MEIENIMESFASDVLEIRNDPRPLFVEDSTATVRAVLRAASGLPDATTKSITAFHLNKLYDIARRKLPQHLGLEVDLADFGSDLLAAIKEASANLRQQGSSKWQISQRREDGELGLYGYGAAELQSLTTLCEDGDEIIGLDFDGFEIRHEGETRVISRNDLIVATMLNNSNVASWRRAGGFIEAKEVTDRQKQFELKAAAARNVDSGRHIVTVDGKTLRA
jgi:hypothetical protein